ncbi:putative N-acetylated-alpha-linked acidic dipeptidase [Ptychodera flava]|uniref:putative N-acetylated-alpha-linked acidic dipeptidase n=1 Tax=Ptychodera flava TaxID=63121 RepID=UPI00396AAF21
MGYGRNTAVSLDRYFLALILGVVLLVGFAIGILIGHFAISKTPSSAPPPQQDGPSCGAACKEPDADGIFDKMVAEMKTDNIKNYLRRLTSTPHLAGTPADLTNAEYVRDQWLEQGLDSATLYPYDVLLAYPEADNLVQLLDEDGEVNFTCAIKERGLREEEDSEDIVNPFNAYSGSGTVEGDLVYVNYGRDIDFDKLEEIAPDLNLTGKILIARYGKIFRGNKALHAEQYGAVGLILYSDPADYAAEDATDVYPDSWWLPDTGAQRGNLHVSDHKGDPLTPGYPAKDYAYRTSVEDSPLPTIPVHPIGYGDAKMFLRELTSTYPIPEDWKGGLDIEYNIGPGFMNPDRKARMEIHTTNQMRKTYNTIGFIRGAVEPDRYVLLGNHRDAWIFGAIDPSSGTAAMLELSRAFGKLMKDGWRPRRSIMFCSWGAEEYGLIGSSEWVEEFAKNLGARSVAYINVDIAVSGPYSLRAKSTPLLYKAVYRAAQKITSPEEAGKTLYETWLERIGGNDGLPSITNLGSGSDFAPFAYQIGVTALDLSYRENPALGLSSYPVYHSVYETFYLFEKFIDPAFRRSLAVAQLWGEVARDLAESVIIPFDCNDYAEQLESSIGDLKGHYESKMKKKDIDFDAIDAAVGAFKSAAKIFHEKLAGMKFDNAMEIRQINDQLMSVERAFIDPLGLPNRKFLRHVVYAPSGTNYYAASAFPGINDAMYKIEDDDEDQWNVVRQQMAVAAFTIESAATTMMDVEL